MTRGPRVFLLVVLVVGLAAVSVAVWRSWTLGTPGIGGWTQTETGPLGPADRDLLVKVRLAGLWEQPTGQQAAQQATTEQVREIGGHIAGEHGTLDQRVREVADQLGVLLPSQPNEQQQAWMVEIEAAVGSDYDRVFVQRLRQAHGGVLPVIAEVRAGTRNELIRAFAVEADEYVTRHIGYLESTGLVEFTALPPPESPGFLGGSTEPADLVIPLIVFATTAVAAVALLLAARRPRTPEREDPHGTAA